jgi:tetratricopeptide (TPR) repeat protein
MYAHQEAIDVYEQAICLFSNIEVDIHSRVQIYEQLGNALKTTGRHGEAKECFESAVALTRDPRTLSRLYRSISSMHFRQREYEQAHLALDEAEAALQRASPIPPETWWREWLDNQFGRMNCYYWCNQIQDMVRLSEEMRPIVEKYGSPRQTSKFHSSLANLGFRQERYVLSDEVLAHSRAAYAAVEDTDELEMIIGSRFLVGFSHLWHGWHGDLDEAVADLQATLETFEEMGDVLMRTRCLNYLAIAHRRRGDQNRVAELLPQVMAAAKEGDLQEYIATAEANLAWLRWLEGDLKATEEHGKEALAIWQSLPGIMPIQWTALWPLIAATMAQGELSEAVSYAEMLLSPDMSRQPADLVAALQQAINAMASNQPETARASLRTALQLARQLNQL